MYAFYRVFFAEWPTTAVFRGLAGLLAGLATASDSSPASGAMTEEESPMIDVYKARDAREITPAAAIVVMGR